MNILRTADHHFNDLPNYPFSPNYTTVYEGDIELRLHYVDEGPSDGAVVLLLHGEPSWSYLYRKMIPVLAEAGFRVLAPDLIGFGRSDKPDDREFYTYARHLGWLSQWLDTLELKDIHLFCQDWGGLLGLRLVAAKPELYATVTAANTGLPTGDVPASDAFKAWQQYSQTTDNFDIGAIISRGVVSDMSSAEIASYNAPFPDDSYKAGARQFPVLVPTTPDNPESANNKAAWEVLSAFDKPFLTAFSDQDPITRGGDDFIQKMVAGCKGQPHATTTDAGHFLQDDKGEELAQRLISFISQ